MMNVSVSARNTLDVPAKSVDFAAGTVIGNYKISSLLAEGSQSTVFNVVNVQNGATCAMRVYFDGEKSDEELVRKLENTTERSLCPILSKGTHGRHYYEVIPKLGALPDIRRMEPAQQDNLIAHEVNAIKTFHLLGFLHLDIKKEHFMLNNNGYIALVDIGSAAKIGTSGIRTLTQFSAPENYSGTYRKESDLFSFGIAILEQFLPDIFNGKSRREITQLIFNPDWISESVRKLPERLQNDVASLLSDNPAARNRNRWFGEPQTSATASNRRTVTGDISVLRNEVASKLMNIVSSASSEIFRSVQRTAVNLRTDDVASMIAFSRFLDTVHIDNESNYTNITSNNVLKAVCSTVVTSAQELSKKNPVRSLKKMSKNGTYYLFSKKLIDSLDSSAAQTNNLKNKTAWSILKGIGYVVGAIAAVAAGIAIIALALYILWQIIKAIVIFAIICGIIGCLFSGG